MKKTFLLAMVAILAMFLILAGCDRAGNNSLKEKVDNGSVEKIKPVENSKAKKRAISKSSSTTTSVSLGLYFADAAGEKLVKERHKVAATNEVAKASIEQLIDGSTEKGHYATIPKGSKLLGISIQDKVATVNFSQAFVNNHPGGSSAEILTIFSIVNTLTEYSSITSVRFQVEGRNITSIVGHYDLSEPVKRDESLIKGQ